jgi:hypothetical protein
VTVPKNESLPDTIALPTELPAAGSLCVLTGYNRTPGQ